MSFDAQIDRLNTNLETLIALLSGGATLAVGPGTTRKKPEPAAPTPTEATPPTPPKAEAPSAPSFPDYKKAVEPVALSLAAKKGRDALVNLLKEFSAFKADGVTPSATGLKPEQYAAFIERATAAAA